MGRIKLVIADSDALIALSNLDDVHHHSSRAIARQLLETDAQIFFPTTTIVEAVTSMQRKLSNPGMAAAALEFFETPNENIVIRQVDPAMLQAGIALFNPNGSKNNTLFDCIVAALARQYNADAIFSFDKWYQKLGFKLTSDLF
jgi:predicted nucleic acid-binding protein